MRLKNLLGKTVIDAAGDDLGKVDDLEMNWEAKSVENIVIKGDADIKRARSQMIFGITFSRIDLDLRS
jgi:sporulation protein YlmC with PRC-barrel domain